MNAIHPTIAAALRPFAPAPEVTVKRTRTVSPFEVEFRGSAKAKVEDAARAYANGIDAYRSPAVSITRMDDAEWVTTLRFYGVE